jgi:DNA-binding MarR family transcriptional regulator
MFLWQAAVHRGCMATTTHERTVIDRVLAVFERRGLSPSELRVLLKLLDREASLRELSEMLGKPPSEVFRAGSRLATRGLARWYHAGARKESRLVIATDGQAAMRVLLAEAEQAAGESKR